MRKLADLCSLLAAVALLAATLAFFEPPLRVLAGKAGAAENPLTGIFGPSAGFMAGIASQPPGATVKIDGKPRGVTPFLGNVACHQGDKVKLEIELPGYQTWKRELDCRENGQLTVDAKLSR